MPEPQPPRFRFAAFDLDGTLLDCDGRAGERLGDRIAQLRERNIVPIIVTGRSLRSFLTLDLPEALSTQFADEVLLADGNIVFDRLSGAATIRHAIPREVSKGLLRNGASAGLVFDTGFAIIADSAKSALMYAMVNRLPRRLIAVDERPDLDVTPAVRITAFAADRLDELDTSNHRVESRSIGYLGAVIIEPTGTCKASALAEHLSLKYGERDLLRVLAFGDGRNDGCLLHASGLGVAMRRSDAVAADSGGVQLVSALGDFMGGSQFAAILDQGVIGQARGMACTGRHREYRLASTEEAPA